MNNNIIERDSAPDSEYGVIQSNRFKVNPNSDLRNMDDPAGLIFIDERSPPNAPNAPPIELNLELPS